MISLLVTLLIVAVVFAVAVWIVRLLPLPPPFQNIILAILGLILLVWLLTSSGLVSGHGVRVPR